MNKKGLAAGLVAMLVLMFIFGITSLFSLTLWDTFENAVLNVDNSTISPEVKEQITALGGIVGWADKIFVFSFVMLLGAYLISSVTIPVDNSVNFLIFAVFLLLVTLLSMVMANTWSYFANFDILSAATADLPFTDFFLRFYPFLAFFTGVAGALLFYARSKSEMGGGASFE
jgi:hypothetical protein